MKIVYLYAEVMGYTVATINALAEAGVEMHIVYWDKRKLTPYLINKIEKVKYYKRSELNYDMILDLLSRISPDITMISGWQDNTYIKIAREMRKKNKIVVTSLDGQWHGTLKQYAGYFLGIINIMSRYYSHAWVAGIYQYEYARRLGFSKKNIIFDMLSADTALFEEQYKLSRSNKERKYPHRFLFVGRLEKQKGIDILLKAWEKIDDKKNWELHIVGDGSLKKYIKENNCLIVKEFMQPTKLVDEIKNTGCFVLPSRDEPWGVVVHEFVTAGLPVIVSDVVGSATEFVVNGYNGYVFKNEDYINLSMRMQNIINTTDDKLLKMGEASYGLSKKISPKTSAYNLISILS